MFITLWSKRFSVAKGFHFVRERECLKENADDWLEVFKKDEPEILFIVSKNKPKGLK